MLTKTIRKQIGFQQWGNDFKNIKCTVFEDWVDAGFGRILRCNATFDRNVTKKCGISQEDSVALKSILGGSIGSEIIGKIKAELEGSISRKITWSLEVETSETYSIKAPPCGMMTILPLSSVRDYVFEWDEKKPLLTRVGGRIKVLFGGTFSNDVPMKLTLREFLDFIDYKVNQQEYIPDCGCKSPQNSGENIGQLVTAVKSLILRVPTWVDPNGWRVAFADGSQQHLFPLSARSGQEFEVKSELLPPEVRFLAGVDKGSETVMVKLISLPPLPGRTPPDWELQTRPGTRTQTGDRKTQSPRRGTMGGR